MQFEIWTKSLADLPIDCIAVGVHDDGLERVVLRPEAGLEDVDGLLRLGVAEDAIKCGDVERD
jgi:hypothetical protein